MFFSLFNSLASFQGYINKILEEKLDVFIIVYLDDILICNIDTGQSYIKAIWWVFEEF